MKTQKSHKSAAVTISIAVKILRDLGTDLSNSCADYLERGDHAAYLEQNPSFEGDCWRTFYRDYQACEILSKADFLTLPGVDRAKVALEKFRVSEENCRATNKRMWRLDSAGNGTPAEVLQALLLARRKIERVLGDFSWDEAVPLMAFGPGASIGLVRKKRHAWFKFGLERPTVTGECATIAEILIRMSPQWSKTAPETPGIPAGNLSIVRGSRVTTVPKNAKTDRVIAIEPLMNMFVQKGIGSVIRRRLRSVGIDLNDQTRNQELAKAGSLSGLLATIDLASASDSIALALVEWLLPDAWVSAMKMCRSKHCVLPSGEEIFLQKFSSMGNGYTFELQSLIFWAISSSVAVLKDESSRDISVYGDDIIVPRSVVADLISVLSFVGFKTNVDKSYWDGPFRESCGKHYFLGHDVTPLYIRKDVNDQERLLWLANGIRRLAHRMVGHGYGCDERLRPSYGFVCQKLDRSHVKLSIPDDYGDGGLVRDFDEARPVRHRYYDGYVVRHLQRSFATFVPSGQPALTLSLFNKEREGWPALHTMPTRFLLFSRSLHKAFSDGVVPFEVTTERYRRRIVKSVSPRWGDLGPWCSGW